MDWSPWTPWEDGPRLPPRSLAETLDGGQAFRWNRAADGFEGLWDRFRVRLKPVRGDRLAISTPPGEDPAACRLALARYFALGTDFDALADALPWRSDPVLRTAVEAFPGLRILRQPPGETLFCFLCSSTKRIPQIKAACAAVAADLGEDPGHGGRTLPSWPALASAGEARLRAAKLGYRALYVHQTAQILAARPDLPGTLASAETGDARQILMALPGVGRKIADCVLLFALGRLEVFPVDTWVFRILEEAYGLRGWKPEQLQLFARAHFGPSAGLAQQFLFAAARAALIKA